MTEKKVTKEDVERLVKGLKGSGNTTDVTGEASGVGSATQLFHKPNSLSSVKTHAGTTTEDISFSGEYSPNGTDVSFGTISKGIIDCIASGKMTAAEGIAALEVLKGLPWEKKEKDAAKDDDKEEKPKAEKAMAKEEEDEEEEDDKVKKSVDGDEYLEVSDFLRGIVDSIHKSLTESEARVIKSVKALITASADKQEGFNKSLVEAFETVGAGIVQTNSRIEQVESQPASAPKSRITSGEGVVAKSFSGESVNLSRTEILTAMEEMVMVKKSLAPREHLHFDSTGEISEETMKKVIAHVQGK